MASEAAPEGAAEDDARPEGGGDDVEEAAIDADAAEAAAVAAAEPTPRSAEDAAGGLSPGCASEVAAVLAAAVVPLDEEFVSEKPSLVPSAPTPLTPVNPSTASPSPAPAITVSYSSPLPAPTPADRPPLAPSSVPAAGGLGSGAAGEEEEFAAVEQSRIFVAVRCRPLSSKERTEGCQDICRVMGGKLVILMDPGSQMSHDYLRQDKSREKRYAFDHAFGQDAPTDEVFAATTKPLIGAVLQAYNASVFAYGSTGAGKTFTMIGTAEVPGVMLRTVEALFNKAAEAADAASSGGRTYAIRCSFVEVYNENLRDLLTADGREGILDLREDPIKGMCVANVTETEAESSSEVLDLLRQGNSRRTTEPTAMNVTSSRSHAVLQIMVMQRDYDTMDAMSGKLSLIDLAGSERASQTDNRGARLIEGANINRSLLALGNCINALASGSSFVPYRDSKLTRLLKDSLGGNCRAVMIANVSPVHYSYEDTLNTLKYANRAKNIRVTAQQQIAKPDMHVSEYAKAINDLRSEAMILKNKLAQLEAPAAVPAEEPLNEEKEAKLQEASEHWKVEVLKNLESRTQLQNSLIEVERSVMEWKKELQRAKGIVGNWDESRAGSVSSPHGSKQSSRHQPKSLEEWQDHVTQIEESIRENTETRQAIAERLLQNRAAGKDLHNQLPSRVMNADLRAFLELIQRIQVQEVDRLQLDHGREIQRTQLQERDDEIEMLRHQLRLRNEHLRAQRARLSEEQQDLLPPRVSLLGSTLAEASPVQQRGPLRVMHAWAPKPKDEEELASWDPRPLREREADGKEGATAAEGKDVKSEGPQEEEGVAAALGAIDWKNLELPKASQIRGLAQMRLGSDAIKSVPPPSGMPPTFGQPPAGANQGPPALVQRMAPKGWRQPPELRGPQRPNPPPRPPPPGSGMPGGADPPRNTRSANPAHSAGVGPAPPKRGSTCPPLRRGSLDSRGPGPRQPSREDTEGPPPPRRVMSYGHPGGPYSGPYGGGGGAGDVPQPPRRGLDAHGVQAPPSTGGGGMHSHAHMRQARARSEHAVNRMNRIGRVVVVPRQHDLGALAGIQAIPK
eukprot:TRINITY_DN15126_c0_g1_i2.p1 TRINITY_DN15126_c0_g1~~TRINITY_DN15126_c0_g1_i2.p1  ORF type:complete len:1076 (+),score=271.79 TRINITY_DN15126_c0_g1_i2:220-3447(+)